MYKLYSLLEHLKFLTFNYLRQLTSFYKFGFRYNRNFDFESFSIEGLFSNVLCPVLISFCFCFIYKILKAFYRNKLRGVSKLIEKCLVKGSKKSMRQA